MVAAYFASLSDSYIISCKVAMRVDHWYRSVAVQCWPCVGIHLSDERMFVVFQMCGYFFDDLIHAFLAGNWKLEHIRSGVRPARYNAIYLKFVDA